MAIYQKLLTINHETAKYDEKIESFCKNAHDVAEP